MSKHSDDMMEEVNRQALARRVNEHKTVAYLSLDKARKEVTSLYSVTGLHMYKALVVLLDFSIDLLMAIGDKRDA